MPVRIDPFVDGEYYHIYNRGVNKAPIFQNFYDYSRFLKTVLYYQLEGPKVRFSFFSPQTKKLDLSKKIIQFISYCLIPNHIHFLIKQERENGITEFMSKLTNSYTKYYNIKHRRVGYLFQAEFKSVLVENNEQLLHLSRYIHLNPLVSELTNSLSDYSWSSYPEYIGLRDTQICDKDIILGQFKTRKEYQQFVLDQASYGLELEFIKHHLLDPDDQ